MQWRGRGGVLRPPAKPPLLPLPHPPLPTPLPFRLELRPVMSNEQVCQVSTLLTLLSGVLTPLGAAHLSPDHYERLFLYCATWSLGGLLEARDRPRFDAHLRALTDQAPEKVGGGAERR